MKIYNGPHLFISYEEGSHRFVNYWKSDPPSINVFKTEMLEYLHALEMRNPSQILWLQQDFSFHINDELKSWIDETISKRRYEAGFIGKRQDGFDQIAFVVGKDVMAHIEVMDIFKEKKAGVFNPRHFATEDEARNWLNGEINNLENQSQELKIRYKGLDSDGKAIIELIDHPSKISNTIQSINTILSENQFIKDNINKFSLLTPRERQILTLIINGKTNGQISDDLNVSIHTIRTHRNRIWKKLEIKHFKDCLKYNFFLTSNL